MAPRRDPTGDAAMAALIAQQMAAILPTLVTQLNQANANANQGNNLPRCDFKHFNSCHPPKFLGSEGATGLLQWFEGVENTFLMSNCPDNLRVRYASSMLQARALTWWNGEKRTRGTDAALALLWEEFKGIMTSEFCPRNEIKKLESEFWDLKQISGDNLLYTNRFQELSILVPHMVAPLDRAIEKYIGGLPMPIQDTVLGSNPTSLEAAIRLAAILSDNHVRAGTLTRGNTEKEQEKTTPAQLSQVTKTESPRQGKKRKAKNLAVVTTAVPINQVAPENREKKGYTGTHPPCNTCCFHHPPAAPCRFCSICGRYGHTPPYCKTTPQPNQPKQPNPIAIAPPNQPQGGACYECGDPNHYRNQCPKLIIVNQGPRGRAFNINTQGTQANNDEL